MRLKCKFECMELDNYIVAVPIGKGAREVRGVLKLNDSAATVLNLLQEGKDEELIVVEMMKEYDMPKDVLAGSVHDCIIRFRESGIILE